MKFEDWEYSVITKDGFRDVCRDLDHARTELKRWKEYIKIEKRYVSIGDWMPYY